MERQSKSGSKQLINEQTRTNWIYLHDQSRDRTNEDLCFANANN